MTLCQEGQCPVFYDITNSIELSPSSEAASRFATQEVHSKWFRKWRTHITESCCIWDRLCGIQITVTDYTFKCSLFDSERCKPF
jgi:hypothetical protein